MSVIDEMGQIKQLLPTGNETHDERTARNCELRNLLLRVSNSAIAVMFWEHPLCGQEGINRLKKRDSFSLNDLCRILTPLGRTGIQGKNEVALYKLVLAILPEVINNTSSENVSEIIEHYSESILDLGTYFVDEIRKLAHNE